VLSDLVAAPIPVAAPVAPIASIPISGCVLLSPRVWGNSRAVRRSVDVETCYTSNIDALRARYAPTSKASPDILTRLAVRWRCLSPAERQEATARCANRRLPVSFKALIRRGSRLAVMHANDDSLGVRSASVSGSDAEGRPFEVRQSARPTFFIWPHYNPVLKFSEVSRGDCRPCG
jgi:hypothetical protein